MRLLAVAMVLLPLNMLAYNLVVTLKVAETGEKIPEVRVFASNENASSIYAYADYSAADSTYILKELPEKELSVFFKLGEKYLSDTVATPRDSAVIEVPQAFLPQATELKELVVSEQSSKFEDNRQIYLPSKRDKRISQDGSDLLRNMAIPTISVTDEAIKTAAGESVSVFIDYLPASPSDVANIRTGDVRNVEVYDFPQDPRFGGAQHVVNFIMVRYEYGGYTKLTGVQRFVTDQGYYSVFSKFAYKKMTYDITGGYNYGNTSHDGTSTDASYRFGDETVDYSSRTLAKRNHGENFNAAFRAVYQDKKTVISNIVGFKGDKPHSSSSSRETFSNPAYTSGDNSVFSKSDNTDVSWNGNYQFFLPKKYTLIVKPRASYARNRENYSYTGLSEILNDSKENAWEAGISATANKGFGNHSIGITGYASYSKNDIDYYGTTPATTEMTDITAGGTLTASLNFGKLYISPSVDFKHNKTKINGLDNSYTQPGYNIFAAYGFGNKRQLSVNSCIYYGSLPASYMGDNYQITDQINAIKGNPELKTQVFNTNLLQYTSFPTDKFSYTAYVLYDRTWRNMAPVYAPAEIGGYRLMLRDIVNSGFTNHWEPGLVVTLKLLKNSLTMRGTAKGNIVNQHGPLRIKKSKFEYDLQASYSFSDFYASASYSSGVLGYSTWNIMDRRPYYNFSFGWSNGNLNVRLRLYNPFTSGYKTARTWMDSPYYSYSTDHFYQSNRRNFQLSVIYSFSYGKKVNREEINAPQGVQSGILQ